MNIKLITNSLLTIGYEPIDYLGEGSYGRIYKCKDKKIAKACRFVSTFNCRELYFSKVIAKSENNLLPAEDVYIKIVKSVVAKLDEKKSVNIISLAISPLAESDLHKLFYQGVKFDNLTRCFQNLLSAVNKIHKSGFLHLDIKPSNILIKNDSLILADYGLISWQKSNFLRDNNLRITEPYRPLELKLFKHITPSTKSDIWSLGIVFLELLMYYIFGVETHFFSSQKENMKIPNYKSEITKYFLDWILFTNTEGKESYKNLKRYFPNGQFCLDDYEKYMKSDLEYPNLEKILSVVYDKEFKCDEQISLLFKITSYCLNLNPSKRLEANQLLKILEKKESKEEKCDLICREFSGFLPDDEEKAFMHFAETYLMEEEYLHFDHIMLSARRFIEKHGCDLMNEKCLARLFFLCLFTDTNFDYDDVFSNLDVVEFFSDNFLGQIKSVSDLMEEFVPLMELLLKEEENIFLF